MGTESSRGVISVATGKVKETTGVQGIRGTGIQGIGLRERIGTGIGGLRETEYSLVAEMWMSG